MQRQYRLRHEKDFARLRQRGRAYRHPLMILSLMPNDLHHNRYGFITSKQVGKAVVRNHVRRILREAVRLLHFRIRSGWDIVIVARPTLVRQPFGVIKHTIEELCFRAGVLVEENNQT